MIKGSHYFIVCIPISKHHFSYFSCEIPIVENGVVTVLSSDYNQPESTTIKIECVDERYRPFPPNLGPIFVCTNGKWDKEIPVCGYIVPNRQG